jgi:two-component system NarL family response regulator
VEIECDRDLALTVQDDGIGFDPDQRNQSLGLGIEHMRERAGALGGLLTVDSGPRGGTRVRFELLGVGDADGDLGVPAAETGALGVAAAGILRVFIIDRHPLMRAGLLHLVGSASDLRVVGQASSAHEAGAQLRRLRPDVVLLDGHLPVGDVEQLIRELHTELPLARIVIMFESATGHEVALAEAGASRFLNKTTSATELAEIIRAAAGGAKAVPAEFPTAIEGGTLSARERSILLLMAAGRTNTEIGLSLFLATKTVERQVATIVRKLGARNRAHAAAIAVSRHIVDPDAAG